MGLITKIASLAGFERRDATVAVDPSWEAIKPNAWSIQSVGPRAWENISAVIAATNAIARALASVPIFIYRVDESGNRVEAPRHPLALIARRGVNSSMSWFDFCEHLITSVLLYGNGLAVILRGASGQLEGFRFVPWSTVSTQILASGRIKYTVSDALTSKTEIFLEGDVLHVKDRSDDGGRIGRSVLSRAAETFSAVHGANGLAAATLRNGSFPSGVLTAPGAIGKETAERLKQTWDNYNSYENAGRVAVAGDGLKFEALTANPQTLELLESRKFGIQDVARIFQVPLIFCGDFSSSTYTNAETMVRLFGSFGLGQWARKIEQAFSLSVLSEEYEMTIDLSAFLRGDPTQRWSSYDIASRNKILTPNEIREVEGYNPLPDGDRFPELPPRVQPLGPG